MRDLTEEEIEEYLQYAKSDRSSGDFRQEQADLVGRLVVAHGLMDVFARRALECVADGLDMDSVILTQFVWAFQMGRECESRLLTRALKGR